MSVIKWLNPLQGFVFSCVVLLMLSSCEVEELNDIETDQQEQGEQTGGSDNSTQWNFEAQLLLSGEAIYLDKCIGCHASHGSLPVNGNLNDCASCVSHTVLANRISSTMPPSDSTIITGDDAYAVAAYVLVEFNGSENTHSTVDASIIQISNKAAAYKIAFDLVSKIPTQDEVAAFEANNKDEILDRWLDSEAFYTRLMQIYNDQMHTDRYHSRFERESNYRNGRDLNVVCDPGQSGTCNNTSDARERYYANVNWWNDLSNEGLLADLTNDAVASEPLQIIRYVAKNDRPFSEILTADYAMVNAYSARSLEPNDINGDPLQLSAFAQFDMPMIDVEVSDETTMELTTIQAKDVSHVKEVFKELNVLRSSDLQLRPGGGSDDDYREFIETYPQDPRDFLPVKLTQDGIALPHAGILTTKAFLNNYTTTPTNMNRARARFVYKLFAATDILALEGNRDASLIDFSDSIGAMDPTKTNEDCLVCHRRIDPVADGFKNWLYSGVYKNESCSISNSSYQCSTIPNVGIGFEGETAQIFGSQSVDANALQWLAEKVSDNPLFAKSVAVTLFTGFTGRELLHADTQKGSDYQASYVQQQNLISAMVNAYKNNDQNIKAVVKLLLNSDYYLAESVTGSTDDYQVIGSDRLLSPDRMQEKIYAITDHKWSQTEVDDSFRMHLGNRSTWRLYGGLDHNNTKTMPNEQGGIMVAMQYRMANEIACFMSAQDFYRSPENRKLFELIDYEPAKSNTNGSVYVASETQVRQTLVNLHLKLWHKDVTVDSPEVDMAFELYQSVLQTGQQKRLVNELSENLSYLCRVDYDPDSNELLSGENRVYRDQSYVIRTWAAVMNYFLKDFEFSHM